LIVHFDSSNYNIHQISEEYKMLNTTANVRRTTFLQTSLLVSALLTLLPSIVFASKVIERPGVGYTPAYVCVATTITATGHTKQSKVVRGSGNPIADRNALRFVRTIKFIPPTGTSWADLGVDQRNGHVLVRMHQNGQMAFKLFEPEETLPPICFSPYESVQRDAEINAQKLE
jgi:TonB family protein